MLCGALLEVSHRMPVHARRVCVRREIETGGYILPYVLRYRDNGLIRCDNVLLCGLDFHNVFSFLMPLSDEVLYTPLLLP